MKSTSKSPEVMEATKKILLAMIRVMKYKKEKAKNPNLSKDPAVEKINEILKEHEINIEIPADDKDERTELLG